MECYLLSEPKIRGWLNKGMFWVSEQRLLDQANTIHRNSWMSELEREELERNLAENDSYKGKVRTDDDRGSNLGEKVRDIVAAVEADEEIGNLEKEEVAIVEQIAEVLEKDRKTSYQFLEIYQRRSC